MLKVSLPGTLPCHGQRVIARLHCNESNWPTRVRHSLTGNVGGRICKAHRCRCNTYREDPSPTQLLMLPQTTLER